MELFEQIRREYRFGVGTVRGVAKQLGVHRRMVRQAIASAIPPGAQGSGTGAAQAGAGDRVHRRDSASRPEALPRKQRHTAQRIWRADSRGMAGRSRCPRNRRCVDYAAGRKHELGMASGRRSCRRLTTGARRRRSIGTKPSRKSWANSARSMFFRCARWRVAGRFIALTTTPHSRRFWKRTSLRSATLAECFGGCATTT